MNTLQTETTNEMTTDNTVVIDSDEVKTRKFRKYSYHDNIEDRHKKKNKSNDGDADNMNTKEIYELEKATHNCFKTEKETFTCSNNDYRGRIETKKDNRAEKPNQQQPIHSIDTDMMDYDVDDFNTMTKNKELLNALKKNEGKRELKRIITNDKMIKRQKKFADKNQAIYYKNTKSKNVKVGDYVRIKVDKRDRYLSNYASLGGIVLYVIPKIFSIHVITNDGILSSSKGYSRRAIPVSEYDIVSEGVVETSDFKDISRSVISSTLQEDTYRNIGMKEMHKLQVMQILNEEDIAERLRTSKERRDATLETKWRCKCKQGNCTSRCGCHKKNLQCTKHCTCHGKCPREN